MRILIVEDEKGLRDALNEILIKHGYVCDLCADGVSGLDAGLSDIYDLIILDIMLPKLNGLDILRNLREQKIQAPILLLTAKSEVEDKIKGLDYGADDYLTKPFDTGEFLARIRALTRRKSEVVDNDIEFGDLKLNTLTKECQTTQHAIKLGAKEYQILELFMRHPNQILSKEQIFEKVWGFDDESEYNNVEVYISFIRKKLTYLKSSVLIKVSRNIGYYLEVGNDS
ncbi:MAG: response regulator transcription factor [Erysipelotrichaceae bacterium]